MGTSTGKHIVDELYGTRQALLPGRRVGSADRAASMDTHPTIRPRTGSGACRALHRRVSERLTGPGGLYNAGNAIGLFMGVALQIGTVSDGGAGVQGAVAATVDYLAGNAAAVALTAATAVFFVGGEAYHRAWANGFPPDRALNRRGDVLSGLGALVLGVALLSLGQVMLAATAGMLHAFGKFGSACDWRVPPGWRRSWPDFYRSAVLASRIPAILAALFELGAAATGTVAARGDWLTPATLLVCYALWSSADLLLFRAKSSDPAAQKP